jgi:hypothetical protein
VPADAEPRADLSKRTESWSFFLGLDRVAEHVQKVRLLEKSMRVSAVLRA